MHVSNTVTADPAAAANGGNSGSGESSLVMLKTSDRIPHDT